MKLHTKFIAVLCMSCVFFPQLAVADCTIGNDDCFRDDFRDDNPNSGIKKEDIALLVAATVLVGTGIWYLMSDKKDGNIHNYKTTALSTTNKGYRFSLAPTAEGGTNGLALQFSYLF